MDEVKIIYDDIISDIKDGIEYIPKYGSVFNDALMIYWTSCENDPVKSIHNNKKLLDVLTNIYILYNSPIHKFLYRGTQTILSEQDIGTNIEYELFTSWSINIRVAKVFASKSKTVLVLLKPGNGLEVENFGDCGGEEEYILQPMLLKITNYKSVAGYNLFFVQIE